MAGDRAITVGGDAIGSLLVTGDNNTFFVGRYERLADAFLRPNALYDELEIGNFSGRGWLLAQFDDFVGTHDRGYVVVEGDAGVGKTSFAAWLSRERGYPQHFVRLMPDRRDVGVAVRNIASQLIRAWTLDGLAIGGVLPPNSGRPDFLYEVLQAAAGARDQVRPGEPIVVVVDGLDETVAAAGENPLGLPAVLPPGVYFLLTQRPLPVPLRIEVPSLTLALTADAPENLQDMRDYLTRWVGSAAVATALHAAAVDPASVVEALTGRSLGVWIYLRYVCAEIAAGTRDPAELDDLPLGVWRYYGQFWVRWHADHEASWVHVDLPLLATLAATTELLSAETLADLSGVEAALIEELLDGTWRPFVQVADVASDLLGEARYRLFHDSLREFCSGSVKPGLLARAEQSFARRLSRATLAAHARIGRLFLDTWGGLGPGLPALRDGGRGGLDAYGLRHVAEHLDRCGRTEDLHALLGLYWTGGPRPVNAWYAAHARIGDLDGYRADVRRADEAARRETASALRIRYLLVLSSLNSDAAASPPSRWAASVCAGRMTFAEALARAREIPSPPERVEALTTLIGTAPAAERDRVQREALAGLAGVPDGFWRVGEIARLHASLSPEMFPELVRVVDAMTDAYYRVVARRVLAVADDNEELPAGGGEQEPADSPSGLAASGRFIEAYLDRRATAVQRLKQAGIAPGVADNPEQQAWLNALAVVEGSDAGAEPRIGDGNAVRRARALLAGATSDAVSVAASAEAALSEDLDAAMAAARGGDPEAAVASGAGLPYALWRGCVRTAAASRSSADRAEQLIRATHDDLRRSLPGTSVPVAIAALAPAMPEPHRRLLLTVAQDLTDAIGDEHSRALAQLALVRALAASGPVLLTEAWAMAGAIEPDTLWADAVACLAAAAPAPDHNVRDVLKRPMTDPRSRARAVLALLGRGTAPTAELFAAAVAALRELPRIDVLDALPVLLSGIGPGLRDQVARDLADVTAWLP